MKRKIILNLTLSIILIFTAFMSVCEAMFSDIKDNIVRLHIVANSNLGEDQKVKLKVRDEIIKYANENGEIDLDFVRNNKEKIEERANKVLLKNGFSYKARVEAGEFNFPKKSYENVTLPKGNYNAVRIVLGEGDGENWWCVMYPPLCFSEKAKGELSKKDEKLLKKALKTESAELILNEKITLKPAFLAIELLSSFKEKVKPS